MAVRYPEVPQVVDPTEVHINYFCDQLINRINERRVELLTTVRNTRQEKESRPAARARMEEELIALKSETLFKLQMNVLHDTQQQILEQLEAKLVEARTPIPETRIVFRGDAQNLEQLIRGVGEILEEEVSLVPNYRDMRSTVAVGKQGMTRGELWCPNCVAIDTTNNNIYVSEGDGISNFARVSIFSEMGECLHTFSHEAMELAHGIGVHGNNVYVTDIKICAVFHFKIEAEFRLVARLGSRGTGLRQFNYPCGLTVSTNGDVYVADSLNHRINILNSSLDPIRDFKHPSIQNPNDVKLTAEEMYVLCQNTPSIHVFSHTGLFLRSFITSVQVNKSYSFCVDDNKSIIISDFNTHQIKIFSNEGSLLHTLGEEGQQEGMLYEPGGLALTSSLKLVTVSRNTNTRLQIFS